MISLHWLHKWLKPNPKPKAEKLSTSIQPVQQETNLPTLQTIAKTQINLGNPEEKKGWGNAWLAVGAVMKEAADKGENISIRELIKRSIAKNETIHQHQNALTNGTDNTGETDKS